MEVRDMRSTQNKGRRRSTFTIVGLMLLIMLGAAISSSGQTVFGRISGTVKDSNGSAIPNATVTITNAATNLVRTATTDEDGFYTATNLPVGSYTVAAVGNGFKKAEESGIAMTADARLTIDLALE